MIIQIFHIFLFYFLLNCQLVLINLNQLAKLLNYYTVCYYCLREVLKFVIQISQSNNIKTPTPRMNCNENSCEGGLKCCVNISYYPGFYCKVVSQCFQQPLWQVIVIPALLGFLTLIIALIIYCKLRNVQRGKRTVETVAYQQIRVKPKIRNGQIVTYTTLPENMRHPAGDKLTPKQTQATTNNRLTPNTLTSPK